MQIKSLTNDSRSTQETNRREYMELYQCVPYLFSMGLYGAGISFGDGRLAQHTHRRKVQSVPPQGMCNGV